MRGKRLGESLREIELPNSDTALEQSVADTRAELARRRATAWRSGGRRLGAALAAVCIVALIGGSLTEPGRAATEWLADLVEGDPGPRTVAGQIERGTLVGEGESPSGDRYVVVALGDHDRRERAGPCLFFYWPDAAREDSGGGSRCDHEHISGAFEGDAFEVSLIMRPPGSDSGVVVTGLVKAAADRVGVVYERADGTEADAPAELFPIDGRSRGETGQDHPLSYLVAFLPDDVGRVESSLGSEVVAFDEAGAEIGRTPIRWAGFHMARDSSEELVSCVDPFNSFVNEICREEERAGSPP